MHKAVLICGIFVLISCAGRERPESFRPIAGYWKTDRGIIMSIHNVPKQGMSAVVKETPGYGGEEIKAGKVVISHISPLVDGGYTGIFEMPGSLKPAKIKIKLFPPDKMVIMTWDRRADSKIMRWQRIRGIPNAEKQENILEK